MSVDKKLRELQMSYAGPRYITGAASTTTQLDPDDLVVFVVPPASGTQTIKLPNVAQAMGRNYTVFSNGNDTGVISVVGDGSERVAYTSGNLTAANDRVLLYSDGVMWHEVVDITT